MAIRFDHNNNSEEWQMLFNKINNGSPFGVIKEVFFYDYSPNNPNNSPKLKQFLEHKRELVLAKMHCNPTAICYCGNKQDAQNTDDQNYNSLHYRQSSAQNIKINEIANDLKSGKIVGKKIISDALLGANYLFHG